MTESQPRRRPVLGLLSIFFRRPQGVSESNPSPYLELFEAWITKQHELERIIAEALRKSWPKLPSATQGARGGIKGGPGSEPVFKNQQLTVHNLRFVHFLAVGKFS